MLSYSLGANHPQVNEFALLLIFVVILHIIVLAVLVALLCVLWIGTIYNYTDLFFDLMWCAHFSKVLSFYMV